MDRESIGFRSVGLRTWRDDTGWDFDPKCCPTDLCLAEYLRDRNIQNQNILYVGTGNEHLLARKSIEFNMNNTIYGITMSSFEYSNYIKLVKKNPYMMRYYKCLFCDMYTFDDSFLSMFNIFYLPHLCEYFMDIEDLEYRVHNNRTLVDKCIGSCNFKYLILFKGSCRYLEAKKVFDQSELCSRLKLVERFKSSINDNPEECIEIYEK